MDINGVHKGSHLDGWSKYSEVMFVASVEVMRAKMLLSKTFYYRVHGDSAKFSFVLEELILVGHILEHVKGW